MDIIMKSKQIQSITKTVLSLSIAITIINAGAVTNNDTYAHLQDPVIRTICSLKDRTPICASDNTNVCTAKMARGKMEFRDYENHCYLFLSNMCDHPGKEFYIASSGNCSQYLSARQTSGLHVARRQISNQTNEEDVTEAETTGQGETELQDDVTTEEQTTTQSPDDDPGSETPDADQGSETKPVERMRLVTPSGGYNETEAYDGHPCPGHCTEEYKPVCLIANRGFGMYFKYLTFLNHCQADMYYCRHPEEFAPPPDESQEMISGSRLDWSFCASYRFLQFARFSEVASSMGHYGWLLGDHKYSHILNPEEKVQLSGTPRLSVGR